MSSAEFRGPGSGLQETEYGTRNAKSLAGYRRDHLRATRILFFDPYHGAAGDMIVGSLLDLGVELPALSEPLQRLLPNAFTLSAERVQRSGIAGTKFHVQLKSRESRVASRGGRATLGSSESKTREPQPATHDSHAQWRGHSEWRGHRVRHLKDILLLVDKAGLSAWVTGRAHRCFTRLADAEAAIHQTTPDRVHFHEVGALDSIVDMVGALLATENLAPERICCAPMALGRGTVECAHGIMPLPAPATLALLKDFPTRPGDCGPSESLELCTPTGAALLTTLAEPVGQIPPMQVERTGYGAGSRDDPGVANMLRAVVGSSSHSQSPPTSLMKIECVVDDMPSELLGFLFERLQAAGAVEVTTQAVGLKKSRPGHLVTVLAEPSSLQAVRDALFAETTTFGMRYYPVERFVLTRSHQTVQTPWGPVRVKIGTLGTRNLTASPEYEDCRALAEAHGVPLRRIYAAALEAYSRRGGGTA